jgi:hypothetical protein
LTQAQRIVLTEEQLYYALPWDVRLVNREPEDIRHLMFAHTQAVMPVQRLERAESPVITPRAPVTLTNAPILPLEPMANAIVEVSASELQEALETRSPDDDDDVPGAGLLSRLGNKKRKRLAKVKTVGSFSMQQTLLRVMLDALMAQLYQAQDHLAAVLLQARCSLLAQLERWHRASRQRVVNAVPVWSEERSCVLWQLTVGVPLVGYSAA